MTCCRTLKYSQWHPPQIACFEDRNDHWSAALRPVPIDPAHAKHARCAVPFHSRARNPDPHPRPHPRFQVAGDRGSTRPPSESPLASPNSSCRGSGVHPHHHTRFARDRGSSPFPVPIEGSCPQAGQVACQGGLLVWLATWPGEMGLSSTVGILLWATLTGPGNWKIRIGPRTLGPSDGYPLPVPHPRASAAAHLSSGAGSPLPHPRQDWS